MAPPILVMESTILDDARSLVEEGNKGEHKFAVLNHAVDAAIFVSEALGSVLRFSRKWDRNIKRSKERSITSFRIGDKLQPYHIDIIAITLLPNQSSVNSRSPPTPTPTYFPFPSPPLIL